MKYKILKKSIRVNSYKSNKYLGDDGDEYDGLIINLSLMKYKTEMINSDILIHIPLNNIYANIQDAIEKFKNTDEYESAELKIDDDVVDASNYLSDEYNSINNLSNIKYFNLYYPNLTESDYSSGFINRYIAKFLNHNYLIEISLSDYQSIAKKNSKTHFEAYDAIPINWKLTGNRYEISQENTKELDRLKKTFGDYNTFYGLNDFDAGPFYLTIYDEIPRLYTSGGELSYADTLLNYSGYYHYIKGKLWSGVSDFDGPNRLLIEGSSKSIEDNTLSANIVQDVENVIKSINDELDKYPGVLSDLKDKLDELTNNFNDNIDKAMNEFLDGSSLKEVFDENLEDLLKMQKDPESQSDVEKKTLKGFSVPIPKIKIPNPHIGRPPHGEGHDHAYELGF